MSTSVDSPRRAWHDNGRIFVAMESGLEVSFPVAGNPRLEAGDAEALNRVELSPFGLHWPDLDEDLSLEGILAGNYGQRSHRAA